MRTAAFLFRVNSSPVPFYFCSILKSSLKGSEFADVCLWSNYSVVVSYLIILMLLFVCSVRRGVLCQFSYIPSALLSLSTCSFHKHMCIAFFYFITASNHVQFRNTSTIYMHLYNETRSLRLWCNMRFKMLFRS